MRSVGLARALFAIALASNAILTLSYGDIVPRETWNYGSAILVLVASVGLCFTRTVLPSLLVIGACETVWTVIRTLPIFSTPRSIDAWYGFCEALTPLIGAGILYAMVRWPSRGLQMPLGAGRAVRVAQALFGLTCVFYGWSHFVYADYTAGMVPAWLPARLGLAYFTGLAHIAAGIGITLGILARLAATLEAIMMSLFGLLVWVPSFFMQPRPAWATPTQNQWSELVVNLVLAACAWLVAIYLKDRSWGFASRLHIPQRAA